MRCAPLNRVQNVLGACDDSLEPRVMHNRSRSPLRASQCGSNCTPKMLSDDLKPSL